MHCNRRQELYQEELECGLFLRDEVGDVCQNAPDEARHHQALEHQHQHARVDQLCLLFL